MLLCFTYFTRPITTWKWLLTSHKVNDEAEDKHRYETHWNQVAEKLRKEVRRHSVETGCILVSAVKTRWKYIMCNCMAWITENRRQASMTMDELTGVARILSGVCALFSSQSWRPFFYSSLLKNGALFFLKKLTTFLVVASKRRSTTTNSSSKFSWHSKKCPKNWLLLRLWGALTVLGCTYKFSLWITSKKFIPALGGAGAPTAPLGYAYGWTTLWIKKLHRLFFAITLSNLSIFK